MADPVTPATRQVKRPAVIAYTVGAILGAVSLFLPWHSSGDRERSAFELLTAVDRLDLPLGPIGSLFAWAVPFVPALAAAVVVAVTLERYAISAAVAAAVGVLVGVPAVTGLYVNGIGTPGEIGALTGSLLTLVGTATWRGEFGRMTALARRRG